MKNEQILGAKTDPLAIDILLEQAKEFKAKLSPQRQGKNYKPPSMGYIVMEIRRGRPYYYRRYYITIKGKRVRKKEYLGKELPRGMRMRGK